MAKLRVLVIDDSAYNRQTLSEILDNHPEIEVVGKAFDGEEGLKLAAQKKPDLITLDIEMPRMDGFTFLRLLMRQMPTPVIVISSHSRKEEVFQALELGALDFIAKPSHHISVDLTELRNALIDKVLTVQALQRLPPIQTTRIRSEKGSFISDGSPLLESMQENRSGRLTRIVCIGSSTGGPPALEAIFKAMPSMPQCAILVAQHMPEKFTKAFAERLNRMVLLNIVEANEGITIQPGAVYIAPGGRHMEVVAQEPEQWCLQLNKPESSDRYIPSIDRLFRSTAEHFSQNTLAIVLTGMGSDGSVGIRAVHEVQGKTIAESKESSIVFGMPKEAIQTGCVDEILSLNEIIQRMQSFVEIEK